MFVTTELEFLGCACLTSLGALTLQAALSCGPRWNYFYFASTPRLIYPRINITDCLLSLSEMSLHNGGRRWSIEGLYHLQGAEKRRMYPCRVRLKNADLESATYVGQLADNAKEADTPALATAMRHTL